MLLMSSVSVRACWRILDETLTGWPLGATRTAMACQLWKRRRAVTSSSSVKRHFCACKIRLHSYLVVSASSVRSDEHLLRKAVSGTRICKTYFLVAWRSRMRSWNCIAP